MLPKSTSRPPMYHTTRAPNPNSKPIAAVKLTLAMSTVSRESRRRRLESAKRRISRSSCTKALTTRIPVSIPSKDEACLPTAAQ